MNEASTPPRRMRWWFPATILILAFGTYLWLHARETPFIEQITAALGILSALALVFWYIFLTGLRWRTRFMLAGAAGLVLAAVVFGLRSLTRIDGSIGGSGFPRLAWKWSPPADASVGALQVATNALPAGSPLAAISFPQFLGPDRNGVLRGLALERDWRARPPKELWRIPVGVGWSAFAVAGGRAITQEQRGEHELVVAYDLASGRPAWAHTNAVRFQEALGGVGPRATPTIREGRVYVMGATGILDCLDESTGRLIWSRDVLRENGLGNITWGKSCSPLLVGNQVVVTGGREKQKSLLAYAADDGQAIWVAGRDQAAYSSPLLATLCVEEQILVVNAGSVSSHRPKDGSLVWEYPWPGEFPKVAQPLPWDTNLVLVATGYGIGASFLRLTPTSTGPWTVEEVWKNRNFKPKFTNFVRCGQHVFGLDDGILVCLDPLSGNRVWKEGRFGHGQVLLVEDLLLIQTESGDLVLVEATPEAHQEFARLPALKSKTWNNPVLAGDRLLVRNDQEAICYELPLAPKSASAR